MFMAGIADVEKSIILDKQLREQEHVSRNKRRCVDDPVQRDAHSMPDGVNDVHPPTHMHEEGPPTCENTNNHAADDTQPFGLRDPPQSRTKGFNLGDRPKTMHEKASEKLKKKKVERKCGLCRQPGHKRPNCPDRDKVLPLFVKN
jgi:hypothetical protein